MEMFLNFYIPEQFLNQKNSETGQWQGQTGFLKSYRLADQQMFLNMVWKLEKSLINMFPWLFLYLSLFTTKIITVHFLFLLYLNLRLPGSLWWHPVQQMATVSSRYASRIGQSCPPHSPPNDALFGTEIRLSALGLHSSGTVSSNRKQQGIVSLCGQDSGKMLLISSQEAVCQTGPLPLSPRVRDIAK